MNHYYSKNPGSPSKPMRIEYICREQKFIFNADSGVFSKTEVDFGSRLLIETLLSQRGEIKGSLLDIGCGYGPIGIVLGKFNIHASVTMLDVNKRAIELAKTNAIENQIGRYTVLESDGFQNLDNNIKFHYVVTNPPIRAGKKVIYSFFEGAFTALDSGGELFVVIQKKQGAQSAEKKIKEIFQNAEIINKKAGYFIITAKKMIEC